MEEIKKNENKVNDTEMDYFINATWELGRSLIHFAVSDDNFRLVKQCIQLNADVNKPGNYGRTALFSCKSLEIAKYLVDNGADVNILNDGGDTAVVSLYNGGGDSDTIKYLARITNLDIECGHYDPSTLLQKMISCEEKDLSLFKIVISGTKNINRVNNYSRSYLMNAALKNKYLDVIVMLIESGIDLYLRDRDGKNFYDLAFKYVQKEIEKRYPEFMKLKDMTDDQRKRKIKLEQLDRISE